MKIVEEYLPKQLSDDDIKALIKKTVEEEGASSIKDMGKVMKAVLVKAPTIDGKLASQLVKEVLR